MKRKLIVGLLAFGLCCSTAYAAAVNGLYKGREIVRVTVNGKMIESAVPGQIIDGATMLPLRAVAEALSADVKWDQVKKQADVTLQQKAAEPAGLTLAQLNKVGESVGLVTALNAAGQPIRSGSGFILDGLLITNHHVVEGSAQLKIVFGLKETIVPSSFVFDNAEKDLAAVKFDGPSLKLSLAEPKYGEKVYSLGFPHEKFTISEGIAVLVFPDKPLIGHTAETKHGSSGGILINRFGEVIGVNSSSVEGTTSNYAIQAKYLQAEINK